MQQAIRYTILALALAALPGLAAAQTYGDKAQQPAAKDTQIQTTPAAPATDSTMNKGTPANPAYQKALAACDQKPADQQQACRDAVDARFKGASDKATTDKSSGDKPTGKPMSAPAPNFPPIGYPA